MPDSFAAYRRRIRPIYLGVVVLMTIVCVEAALAMDRMFTLMGLKAAAPETFPNYTISAAISMAPLILVAAAFAWRPVFWAKYLLLLPTLAWLMHGAMGLLLGPATHSAFGPYSFLISLGCGLAMLGLTVTHFVLDWRQPPPRRPAVTTRPREAA
jgi:hypothetical protein